MRRIVLLGILGSAAFVTLMACSATPPSGSFGGGGSGGSSASGGKSSGSSSGALSGGGGINLSGGNGSGSSSSGSGTTCASMGNDDKDNDGWTVANGDCNDCDPNVNPGAIDVVAVASGDGGVPANVDADCNGKFDPPQPCDDNVALGSFDPYDAAKAIELCQKQTDPKKWGLKSAKWVLPDGTTMAQDANDPFGPAVDISNSQAYHLGHGNLSAFGPNHVQFGKKMLALSSGTARAPTDPGYMDVQGYSKGFTSGSPAGFPKESPACGQLVITGQPNDGVALEVVIHTPSNAHGFSFVFNFFTYEWPGYICSEFNDFFVALLSPIPKGQPDGNISFDSKGNPVSVNNAFIDVCGCGGPTPCSAGGKSFPCSLGDASLQGTGFGSSDSGQDHGSTSWLGTSTSVLPGSDITMRWTVYDSGDGVLDTTTLVDGWQWIADPGSTAMTPTTTVYPTPK